MIFLIFGGLYFKIWGPIFFLEEKILISQIIPISNLKIKKIKKKLKKLKNKTSSIPYLLFSN